MSPTGRDCYFTRSILHPHPELLVSCQAADGSSAKGEERKEPRLGGDSAPYATIRRAHGLTPTGPRPGEVVLATFNIDFSLKIPPSAPTLPLGSSEALTPLKSALKWPGGHFTKHIIPPNVHEVTHKCSGLGAPERPWVPTRCTSLTS